MKTGVCSGVRGGLLAALALGLAGCAGPAWRIKRNPEMFGAFPPEAQSAVREGRIEVGYTRDMVFIALGRPQHTYDRVTREGSTEVWTYNGMRYATRYAPVDASYWYLDRRGDVRLAYGWSWIDVGYGSEFPTMRVEFQGDAVAAIESLRR